MQKLILFCLFIVFTSVLFAQQVDTVYIPSKAMHKTIPCVVIKPNKNAFKKSNRLPVVYLLHGYSGNYSNWIKLVPRLTQLANVYQMYIVCPDGGYSSWYFDSPLDSTFKYNTHVSQEVVKYIDKHYYTAPFSNSRAITGLSMGGHGAFYLAWQHPNIFGAVGSMSGGVNLLDSKNRFDIIKRIGDTSTFATEWQNRSAINFTLQPPVDTPAIIFDCGTEDFFYESNKKMHHLLTQAGIKHTYIERSGAHNWTYWAEAVEYQMLFFSRYFAKTKKPN
jgi:S-formylglutathione hydrolase FrmB